MSSQIDLALNEAPKGRPRYFIGKDDTLQPKILAKPSTLMTLPIGASFDLAKLIFKVETTSKHKNKHASCEDDLDLPHQISRCHLQTEDEKY
jgi:hypothetical protein